MKSFLKKSASKVLTSASRRRPSVPEEQKRDGGELQTEFEFDHMSSSTAALNINLMVELPFFPVPLSSLTKYADGETFMDRPPTWMSAIESKNLPLLKWLHNRANRPDDLGELFPAAMDAAAGVGSINIMMWLQTCLNGANRRCTTAPMDLAAANGHLAAVLWLHSQRREGASQCAADAAAAGGHLGVLEWLRAHRPEGGSYAAWDRAAAGGHIRVLEWLQRQGYQGSRWAFIDAARGGHLGTLEWLWGRGPSEDRAAAARAAAAAAEKAVAGGHLAAVEWLRRRLGAPLPPDALDLAAAGGHLGLVRYLLRDPSVGPRAAHGAALGRALAGGHLPALEALLAAAGSAAASPGRGSGEAAAAGGHLAALRFAAARWPQGGGWAGAGGGALKALEGAAAGGHLGVVEWLLSDPGGPGLFFQGPAGALAPAAAEAAARAVDAAAAGGHVGVARALCARGGAPPTARAARGAARIGHLQTLEWLHRVMIERPSQQDAEIMFTDAAGNGHLRVAKWLLARSEEGGGWGGPLRAAFPVALQRAEQRGDVLTAAWLAGLAAGGQGGAG